MTEQTPQPLRPARSSRLRRFGRRVLYVLLALIAVHLVATLITWRMLARELAQIVAKHEPLQVGDIAQKLPPPGTPNAADVYQRAFAAKRSSQEEDEAVQAVADPGGPPAPAQLALGRRAVEANGAYFALLERASRLPTCVFKVEWRNPAAALFPHLAKSREAARYLTARALFQARDGDMDGAAETCITLLRMAEQVTREPTLIHSLVRFAMLDSALRALPDVLAAGDLSPAVRAQLDRQLAANLRANSLHTALLGERAFGIWIYRTSLQSGAEGFQSILTGDETSPWYMRVVAGAYATVGRPLFYLDEVTYLRQMTRVIGSATLPYPQSRRQMEDANRQMADTPQYRGLLVRRISPVFDRAFRVREDRSAGLLMAEFALEIQAYRQARGSYPDSFSALGEGPIDPYSGKPIHYQRVGQGYKLWSIGWDGVDNHGNAAESDAKHRLSNRDQTEDVVFAVAR